MALTLEDIARRSGSSRSTVSRVINGDPKVRDATRERIMKVIEEVNFQPNLAARGLAVGRVSVVGLVIPIGVGTIFTDPFFPLLIQGVSNGCTAQDYSVMLWLAEPDYERRMITKMMYNGLVDGVIVASTLIDDPIVEALSTGKLPFLLIGRHPTNEKISYVDIDNRKSAFEAVEYLLKMGRQRVATISGPRNMVAGQNRLQGYKDALARQEILLDEALMAEGDFTGEGGYRAMQSLLAARPDAVFVASDTMAWGAMQAIQEAKLRIPEDIAVIGFDDIAPGSRGAQALSTVHQPIQEMGVKAAEAIIEMILNPEVEPKKIVLETGLVLRETTGD
ncbi:MAG: LacI family DNA-binding transcriptional regulator [Anaerolineaceae bacterium]|jgi:LacI family transcriptional regulator|nr:LacI family DNA-binding transcriptional regulator [Anaerolineaceae bacterium]